MIYVINLFGHNNGVRVTYNRSYDEPASQLRNAYRDPPSRFEIGSDFVLEPGARVGPIAVGGGGRDAEDGGRLLTGQAREVAELHQFRFDGVFAGEALQGVLEGEQLVARGLFAQFEGIE